MNTLIVSTFDCSFEDFDKFVADFHEEEGHKYVEEYELIKVNDHIISYSSNLFLMSEIICLSKYLTIHF